MNGIVGRNRADALHNTNGNLPPPNQNQSNIGQLQGRRISFGPIPEFKPRLTLTFSGSIENLPNLMVNGKKISLSEEKPVPQLLQKQNVQDGSRMMRAFNSMMRTINNDPQLKEVQAHINNANTVVSEMAGLDPATLEELEHLNESLTTLSDMLDEAAQTLDSRPRDLNQNISQNPVPVQREAIAYLKNLINERLSELSDLVLPPSDPEVNPQDGPTARQVLSQLEGKLSSLYKIPINEENRESIRSGIDAIAAAVELVKTALPQLDRNPGNRIDMGLLSEDLGRVLTSLNDLANGDLAQVFDNPAFAGVSGDVKSLVDATRTQLQSHQNALDKATGLNPLSTKAIFHSKSFSVIGAKNLLKEQLAVAEKKLESLQQKNVPEKDQTMAKESIHVLKRALEFLDDRLEQLTTGNSDARISKYQATQLMGSEGADKGIEKKGLKVALKGLIGNDVNAVAKSIRYIVQEHIDLAGNGDLSRLQKSSPDLREDGFMEIFVDHALRQAGMDLPKDLATELQNRRFDALNTSQWKPITKEVLMRHNGESFAMKSDIVPQSNLGAHFSDMKGGGVVCHASRHFEHGTTVAVSRLTAPDGTKLFEGVRHGIVNTYGISSQTLHKLNPAELEKLVENLLPKEQWKKNNRGEPSLDVTIDHIKSSKSYRRECSNIMQANGSDRRAMDLVATNLLKNDDKLKFALGQVGKVNPQPVDINLNSIALVTPDYMRAAKGRSGPGNERKMLRGQMKALSRLAGDPQPRELKIKNAKGETQTVLVNIKVNAFNFGVNAGAFGLAGKRLLKFPFVSAWGTSDGHNKKAMETLIGSKSSRKQDGIGGQVADWLNSPTNTASQETKDIVRKLAGQVASMWDSKAHRDAGNEPYKMVSRLAVLTSMIGGDTCWNCKSGKDRTGQMDVEAKRLAAEIWMRKDVPEPDVKPDDQTKANRFRMAMEGGNLEIQNYNTGAPGFKLGGVPSLKSQMRMNGNDERYEYFTGIAGFYGT